MEIKNIDWDSQYELETYLSILKREQPLLKTNLPNRLYPYFAVGRAQRKTLTDSQEMFVIYEKKEMIGVAVPLKEKDEIYLHIGVTRPDYLPQVIEGMKDKFLKDKLHFALLPADEKDETKIKKLRKYPAPSNLEIWKLY